MNGDGGREHVRHASRRENTLTIALRCCRLLIFRHSKMRFAQGSRALEKKKNKFKNFFHGIGTNSGCATSIRRIEERGREVKRTRR